jgi:hypothetical protein
MFFFFTLFISTLMFTYQKKKEKKMKVYAHALALEFHCEHMGTRACSACFDSLCNSLHQLFFCRGIIAFSYGLASILTRKIESLDNC